MRSQNFAMLLTPPSAPSNKLFQIFLLKLHERSYLTQQISVLEDGIRLLPRN